MSYLIMVMVGFVMIGIGVVGYLKSGVIVKHTAHKETYLVDGKGDVVTRLTGSSVFEKYELKLREKL